LPFSISFLTVCATPNICIVPSKWPHRFEQMGEKTVV